MVNAPTHTSYRAHMWQEKESRREVAYGLVSRIEGIEIRVVSISE